MARHHWTTKPDYSAECEDCGWTCYGPQALGTAERHHDATLHSVRVGVESAVYYETYERDLARRKAHTGAPGKIRETATRDEPSE